LQRGKIDGGVFATTINLKLELKLVALVQRGHTSTFNRTDVHECVGLAIIALNKAEALHRVEEFDGPGRLFPGKLTLRPACRWTAARRCLTITWRSAIFNRQWFAIDLEISCRNSAAAINQCEPQRLAFGKSGQARLFDGADMDENILSAIVAHDKAKTFLTVEEFDDTGPFANDLGRHPAASTAAAGRTTETAAAAESTASTAAAESVATATAAEAIAAATKTITTTKAIETAFAKTVPFVFAAPAAITTAPFIETHTLFVFLVRP